MQIDILSYKNKKKFERSLINLYLSHTLFPSSCAIAKAMAVFPVPGGPANNKALPAIFLDLIKSKTIPAA